MKKYSQIFFGNISLVQSQLNNWIEAHGRHIYIISVTQSQSCTERGVTTICITVIYRMERED